LRLLKVSASWRRSALHVEIAFLIGVSIQFDGGKAPVATLARSPALMSQVFFI